MPEKIKERSKTKSAKKADKENGGAKAAESALGLAGHGASALPALTVDTYNAELRDADGFLGDRASKRAFRSILEDWREKLREVDEDPLGDEPSDKISKKKLDKVLANGDIEAAGVVHGAIEDYAREFATVIRRFMRLKEWAGTARIVVGGGLREGRAGELAIGRTLVLLKADGCEVELQPIRHRPDHAGLVGAVHLAPSWIFSGHDSILAVDIGGTNIRAGVVRLDADKSPDLADAHVVESELWRHRDDKPKREEAVERLVGMLEDLVRRAGKSKLKLAPFIGIGCPGLINEDGSIERGGQNLPGNWESSRFNLPERLREAMPTIDDHEVAIVMHNDAVVQGLSEVPFMQDVEHWGVLTIGTGLGNARFTNKKPKKPR
jgi:predicted NBD/HSP70 family sugar kinase